MSNKLRINHYRIGTRTMRTEHLREFYNTTVYMVCRSGVMI